MAFDLGSFLTDVLRSRFPHMQTPEEYQALLASAMGTQQPESVNVTGAVPGLPSADPNAPGGGMDVGQRQAAGLYDQGPSGTPGEIPGLDKFGGILKSLPPQVGTQFLLSQVNQAVSPEQQQRTAALASRAKIAEMLGSALGPNLNAGLSVPSPQGPTPAGGVTPPTPDQGSQMPVRHPSISPDLIRSLALQSFSTGGNPADVTALMKIGQGEDYTLNADQTRFGGDNQVLARGQGKPNIEVVNGQVIDKNTVKPGTVIPQQAPQPTAPMSPERLQQEMALIKNRASAGAEGVKLDDNTLHDMADQYLAGDKSVLAGLGYGNAGAANRAQFRNMISSVARERGLSGEDVAQKIAEFGGIQAGERTLGQRGAQIGLAANEASQFADLALKASAAVPRTSFVPINKLLQAGEAAVSDPKLKQLTVATNSLINAYARAVSPNGIPHVADQERGRELLANADSQEAYQAAVDQIMKEIAGAKAAPGQVKQELRDLANRGNGAQAPAPTGGTTAPAGIIQYDKQGRRIK